MELRGKVAVITGGTRGIGLAIARSFAEQGAAVVLASRSQKAVDAAVELIQRQGGQAAGMAVDVAQYAQVQSLLRLALSQFGRLDIWVNNAGTAGPYGPTLDLCTRAFSEVVQTNILGVYHGSRAAMLHFVAQGSGKLINLLGHGYKGPVPWQNAYSASKAWVRSFTKALAEEYKDSGVGVFAALTAMAAGLLQDNYALVMATAPLAGALIGFLRYNFSPASIFLGDSGSYLVGFLLGCYGLLWSQKAATLLGMTAPLMALAIPLMDTGLSVVRRFLRGQPLFGADRGHIHHKLLERGWTVRRAVLVLYGACGLGAVLSLAGSAWQGKMTGLALVVFAVAAWLGVQNLGYAELTTAGKMIRPRGFRRLLGAELALKTMKEGLEKAGTGEEVWRVVERGVKELGYSTAVMELDGARYGEWTGEEGEQWRLVVPLEGRGRLELGHGFHVNGVATVTHPLAMMVREALGERHEEVKG